jgi:biotin-(acetyl-CoA carboxylase) ligase
MHYLSMLNEADKENIHAEYHAHLMHIDEMTRYLAHGQEKQGILRGIDKYGRVIMENNSQTETYQHGEIKLIVS